MVTSQIRCPVHRIWDILWAFLWLLLCAWHYDVYLNINVVKVQVGVTPGSPSVVVSSKNC